jgi:hypothetical protein
MYHFNFFCCIFRQFLFLFLFLFLQKRKMSFFFFASPPISAHKLSIGREISGLYCEGICYDPWTSIACPFALDVRSHFVLPRVLYLHTSQRICSCCKAGFCVLCSWWALSGHSQTHSFSAHTTGASAERAAMGECTAACGRVQRQGACTWPVHAPCSQARDGSGAPGG